MPGPIKRNLIKEIELHVPSGDINRILRVVQCDYNVSLKSMGVYSGEINLDVIFDEKAKQLPGWLTAENKFSGKVTFIDDKRQIVREINFRNAQSGNISGSVDLTNPKEFIVTIRLIADVMTLV